jgi:hypothetical protein
VGQPQLEAVAAQRRTGSDMTSQRLALAVMLLLLALIVASGYWLWGRLQDLEPAHPTVAVPAATATITATPAPTVLKAPPGYRLAGVAVGEPESFAVVEAPSGIHALYRVGEDVPGLGRLQRIEAERVIIQNDGGEFELWLAPASTATPGRNPTVSGTPRAARRTPAAPAPTTGRQPAAPGAGTVPESTPSAVPDQPAS